MEGNRYFARGRRVYIEFQEPSGIKQHIFCIVPENKGLDFPFSETAEHIADALNDKQAKYRKENPHEYGDFSDSKEKGRKERDSEGWGFGPF